MPPFTLNLGSPTPGILPLNATGTPETVFSSPCVGINQDGRLEAFICGADGQLYHNYVEALPTEQYHGEGTDPNTIQDWSGWEPLPGLLICPGTRAAVTKNQDGRLEVFAFDATGALWHNWQTIVANSESWIGWQKLSGQTCPLAQPKSSAGSTIKVGWPAVGWNADGRLEVFIWGQDNNIWHIWQTAPNGGWSNFASLVGSDDNATHQPAVALDANGCLSVVAPIQSAPTWTPNPFFCQRGQSAPNNGWNRWYQINPGLPPNSIWPSSDLGPVGDVAIATNQDGHLEAFVIGNDGQLWHVWQITKAGQSGFGWWTINWESLTASMNLQLISPAPCNSMGNSKAPFSVVPAVATDGSGCVHVWLPTTQGLFHNSQSAPNSGWRGWTLFNNVTGSGPSPSQSNVAAISDPFGNAWAFVVMNGALWFINLAGTA
jgi:hypothetical protein